MEKEQWKKGIEAWENIRKQALIDIEQADLYIEAIKNKMEEVN